jgi:hypothetical protein
MKNATFSHHVRPFPMLLAGAIVSPLVLMASCGSTPDQPAPKPEALVQIEPAPVEVVPDPVELVLAAEPSEAEQAEEKVDLQVAGMRAALQDALRASGIDPETLDVEGAEVPAAEPTVAFEESEADIPQTADEVLEDAVAALDDDEDAALASQAQPEAVLDPALAVALTGLNGAVADAQADQAPDETVAALVDPALLSADSEVAPADPVAAADMAIEQVEDAQVEAEAILTADAAAELAEGEPSLEAEINAEVVDAELALETETDNTEANVLAAEAVEAEPKVAALTDAEVAKIEAELMLMGMDPGRTAPVDFDDFYVPPVEVAPEPELVDEPVLAQDEGVELLLDDALALNTEPAAAETLEEGPLVVVDANDANDAAADLAAPLLAQAGDLVPTQAQDVANEPVEDMATELAGAIAGMNPQATEQDAADPALDQAQEAPAVEPDPVDSLANEQAVEDDPFAKFGAIQWEVTRIQMPADVIAAQAEQTELRNDANGAQALDIQKVPVPPVATAVGNDWGAFQFMRSVPVEQRLLLAPLCAIDPSGGLAGISLAFQGISVSTNMVLEGAPRDPALAGLTYSDGAEFDPVSIEPTATVVNEPGIGMIWWSTELPTTQVHAKAEVQTPSVGRVRIVLNSGDYVEGVMHSAGLGQYKIDGELGRFAVRANLVSHIERLPKPGLGQQVKGLQAGDLVRAKVKTGYIEGRLISMKDGKALVETATGMRISLNDAEVEPMGQSKTRVVID